jgi:type IV secretion system protein VirD4
MIRRVLIMAGSLILCAAGAYIAGVSPFLGVLFGVALGALAFGIRSEKSVVFGDARFATREEIKSCGLISRVGVVIAESGCKPGELLRYDGDRHILVEGPTRSGKGRGIIIPTLLALYESVFVIDIKGENYDITAGKRSEYGSVFRLEPGARNSARYNPIQEIRGGDYELADIQSLSKVICDDAFVKDPHWVEAASALMTAIVFFLRNCAPKSEQSLYGVLMRLAGKGERSLEETISEMMESSFSEQLRAMLSLFMEKTPNEKSGIQSTLATKLEVFWDPLLQENTSESDFSLLELVTGERPVSIFVVVHPGEVSRLKVYLWVLVDQLGRKLTARGVRAERTQRLLLVLDEFPALGRLHYFDTALSYIAGYGVRAMVICQSLKQLNELYGASQSISDNCYLRVFFTPNSIESAEYISRSLGQHTVSYKTSSGRGPFSRSESDHLVGRPLLSPEELLCFPKDELIIFVAGERPIRAKRLLFDKHWMFRAEVREAPIPRVRASWENFYEEDIYFDADELR